MSGLIVTDPLPYPPATRAWSLVAVFFFTAIVSVIDRGIITLLVDPIRRELGVSDIQISLLQGLSFGLFYAFVGLPLGLTADRLSRRRLLIFGITMWSLATIFGGFAANYAQLFCSRLLVGLGEATLSPCAISMIGDCFPPKRRGSAIGVYLMGQAVAGGLAIFVTGLILAAVPSGTFDSVPLVAGLAPWRIAFVLCGVTGFVAVGLLILCREPARRGFIINTGRGLGIAPVAGYMARQWRIFAPFYLGAAILSIATFGLSAWNASLLIRGFGVSPTDVGRWLGPVSMFAGVGGALAGGQLVDFVARQNLRGGKFLILMGVCWGALPSALAALAPTPHTALFLLAFAVATAPMIGTALNAASQEMTPNNMRGIAVALLGFTNTIVGLTLGPLLIALANQHLFKAQRMVGYSIMLVTVPAELAACLLFAAGYRAMTAASGEFKAVLDAEARDPGTSRHGP